MKKKTFYRFYQHYHVTTTTEDGHAIDRSFQSGESAMVCIGQIVETLKLQGWKAIPEKSYGQMKPFMLSETLSKGKRVVEVTFILCSDKHPKESDEELIRLHSKEIRQFYLQSGYEPQLLPNKALLPILRAEEERMARLVDTLTEARRTLKAAEEE